MANDELFSRRYELQAGGLVVRDLDVSFEVERSLRATPNTATIRVRNLAKDSRRKLQELGTAEVSLQAGYVSGTSQIFRGDFSEVRSERVGATWTTTIMGTDGQEARKRRVNASLRAGSSLQEAIKQLAKAMGVRAGNLSRYAAAALFEGTGARNFLNGSVLTGLASQELDKLLEGTNLEWSIQDNELQLLERGKTLGGTATVLSSDTGLVGSPEPGDGGAVQARALMIPDLTPGRRIELRAARVQGSFRVTRVTYLGDTAGQDWYAEMDLRPVGDE